VAETTPIDTARTQAVVRRLLDDAAPVRRLRPPLMRLGLWLIVVAIVGAEVGVSGARPDLEIRLRDPFYLLEIGALGVAGVPEITPLTGSSPKPPGSAGLTA